MHINSIIYIISFALRHLIAKVLKTHTLTHPTRPIIVSMFVSRVYIIYDNKLALVRGDQGHVAPDAVLHRRGRRLAGAGPHGEQR